jgi:hypothetical protein
LFPAWFVIDDYYWVDFEVLNSEEIDYQVHKINDTTYRVIVTGKVQDYFDFNSLGIVNTMNYVQTFTVSQPSLSFGVACGNSYVDRNVSFNFSSNGLHDCSLYVNGLFIEENFNCSTLEFSSFIGRNKFLLTGLDSSNVSQSGVCNIYVNPQDKNFSDMIPVFILLGIVGLMFVIGSKYYLFDVLGFIISIPLALELVPFVNAFVLIIPAVLFLFLVVRKRRE